MKQPERIIVVQASSLHKSPEEVASTGEPQITSGSCVLRRPEIADLVQNALLHFNNRRYILSAWCVMPNHAHVVITPLRGNLLADILHSWKSFTASQINKVLHRRGPLWERESFDHLIRTVGDWEKYSVYTENNPVIAGFCVQPEEWPFSSCGAGFPPAQQRSRAAMDAGRMPAPQSNHSDMDTGFQPAQQKGCSGGEAGKMPAPQL